MGGQIDILFDHLAHSLPHVREGKIRAYAVTAAARSSSAPDISTVDEAGVPKLYVSIWYGLRAPKGTPKDVVVKLNAAIGDALADGPSSQGWLTFLRNHSPNIAAMDLFVVPTIGFDLIRDRDRVYAAAVTIAGHGHP